MALLGVRCFGNLFPKRTSVTSSGDSPTVVVYDNDPRHRLIGITDSGGNMGTVQIGYTVDSVSVFRDLRSGHGVMMRTPIDRPLRKSRNEAT